MDEKIKSMLVVQHIAVTFKHKVNLIKKILLWMNENGIKKRYRMNEKGDNHMIKLDLNYWNQEKTG